MPRYKIKTVQHALAHLGIKELYRWFSIMMLRDMRNIENAELIKLSLIRGKFMELLAEELDTADPTLDYFFADMFSFIDVLLNRPMKQILDGLPISDAVKRALLGEQNEFRDLLDCVVAGESISRDRGCSLCEKCQISARRFMSLYMESLRWAKMLHY